MPVDPHPIEITLYDTNGSTAINGGKVYVRNCTKFVDSDVETTNSSGKAIIDLANLDVATGQTVPYETGDKILIIGHYQKKHEAALYTVTGNSHSQTLNLTNVIFTGAGSSEYGDTVRLLQILTGNTGSSVYYAKIYAVDDGELLAHIETPANNTQNVLFGEKGKGCSGGFVVARENKDLIVTATFK